MRARCGSTSRTEGPWARTRTRVQSSPVGSTGSTMPSSWRWKRRSRSDRRWWRRRQLTATPYVQPPGEAMLPTRSHRSNALTNASSTTSRARSGAPLINVREGNSAGCSARYQASKSGAPTTTSSHQPFEVTSAVTAAAPQGPARGQILWTPRRLVRTTRDEVAPPPQRVSTRRRRGRP